VELTASPREMTGISQFDSREDEHRATAAAINRSRPQWMVLWGEYSHLYWAFPLFDMTRRLIVHAAYPDALVARMDEVEQQFRIWPEQKGGGQE